MQMTGADRAKASRLRLMVKAGKTIETHDAEWLREYESVREAARDTPKGASQRRAHTVEYKESTEEAAAVGVGTAAAEMAAAAAMVREEGRREDSLAKVGVEAIKAACEMYKDMCQALLKRQEALERVHVSMLGAWRQEYMARAEDTAQRLVEDAQKGDSDGIDKLVETLMPMVMGKMVQDGAKK